MRQRYALTVYTAPAAEPLTLAETRLHLRIDSDVTSDDTLISALISSARQHVEAYCDRTLVERTYELKLDHFPDDLIELPAAPAQSVTHIKYYDLTGTEQTWSSAEYQVDVASEPARIVPAYGESWPNTRAMMNAVTVRYVAGYAPGSPADYGQNVPAPIKQAMLLFIGHWYEQREAVNVGNITSELPLGAKHLLAGYRVGAGL